METVRSDHDAQLGNCGDAARTSCSTSDASWTSEYRQPQPQIPQHKSEDAAAVYPDVRACPDSGRLTSHLPTSAMQCPSRFPAADLAWDCSAADHDIQDDERPQYTCDQLFGMAVTHARPIAEGSQKIAPYPVCDTVDTAAGRCKHEAQHTLQDGVHHPGDEEWIRIAHEGWRKRVYAWCFPPLRPYEELCENVAVRSLNLFHVDSHFRRFCICTVKSRPFERWCLVLILANCICLAMDSNHPDFQETHIGYVLGLAEWFFLVAFSLEMVAKILALGLCGSKGAYLKDPWNVIDTIVVVMGWVSLSPRVENISAMRTVRVLRPLRTITGVEGMRMLVATLLSSLPMLLDVLILCGFLFLIFGTVSVQTFAGALRYRCGIPVAGGYNGTTMTNVTSFTVIDGGEATICGDGGMHLPTEGGWFALNGVFVPSCLSEHGSDACRVLALRAVTLLPFVSLLSLVIVLPRERCMQTCTVLRCVTGFCCSAQASSSACRLCSPV
jgi:hypothetical protein